MEPKDFNDALAMLDDHGPPSRMDYDMARLVVLYRELGKIRCRWQREGGKGKLVQQLLLALEHLEQILKIGTEESKKEHDQD